MSRLLDLTPAEFAERLGRHGPGRAWIHTGDGGPRCSDPWLAELCEFLRAQDSGFAGHEAVFLAVGPTSGALFGAFLHGTLRGQAQGGLRLASYPQLGAFLRDGLRLSHAMTRKNALAGLWWGGGKGLIARPAGSGLQDPSARRQLFREYGDFVTSLRGAYVTAEDAGTTPADMAQVFRRTRFVTCIPPALGGSGNPSRATARGVIRAMEAALDFLGLGSLAGKRVAMQGAGQVGGTMIELLLERGVSAIVASEREAARRQTLRARFAARPVTIRPALPGDVGILAEPCDVLAPNALGGVLGPETIPRLRTRIVCGAANNPLVDEVREARALAARGVVYVPDFVCNCLGIVHCADEACGSLDPDPRLELQLGRGEGSLFARTRELLERAGDRGTTPLEAAHALADRLAREPHPILGERARSIVRALVSQGWERAGGCATPEAAVSGGPAAGGD